jgi:hypothetical protein
MAESKGRASCQYQNEPAEHKEQGGCANTQKLHDCSPCSGDAPL